MNSILDKIAVQKTEEVAKAKRITPLQAFWEIAPLPVRDFAQSLRANKPAIIAEIKKASPSKGIIREDFDVAEIAAVYEENGAACLSVLTDVHFFQGDAKYLAIAKNNSSLPVLRKDFIIDEYQLHESRALGADCILLIAAMLDDHQLHDYCQLAHELKMAVLVESHTLKELERALTLPTPLMGINNRSLHTFITDLHCSLELNKQIPPDRITISESGINTPQDIELLQAHGINSFLIGECLMRAENIGLMLQSLIGKTA
jgi:indole-3-glycerol phosphate synthase